MFDKEIEKTYKLLMEDMKDRLKEGEGESLVGIMVTTTAKGSGLGTISVKNEENLEKEMKREVNPIGYMMGFDEKPTFAELSGLTVKEFMDEINKDKVFKFVKRFVEIDKISAEIMDYLNEVELEDLLKDEGNVINELSKIWFDEITKRLSKPEKEEVQFESIAKDVLIVKEGE